MQGEGQHFTTIAHAQAWCLTANFEAQQLRFAHASMSLGRAVRIAQMLGLHLVDGQNVDSAGFLPPYREWAEAEEMRRTWWVIYCSDRLTCASTGWPTMIREQDVWLKTPQRAQSSCSRMLTRSQIETRLPSSEEAFKAGVEEHTSPLTSILDLEGQNLSALAARVLAATHFHQAFQHSSKTPSDEDMRDIQSSSHWKRHCAIDNDLVMLFHCLPEAVKLPNSIRCQNAVFVNILIHTSVICLHRAAIYMMDQAGIFEETVHQSKIRLIAAAEEVLNILRMMPDANEMLKNPMLAFSMYMASLVFLDQSGSAQPDHQRQGNLDLILRFMVLAARTWGNPVTRSMAIQLAVDMRQRGLDSPAVGKVGRLHLSVRCFEANMRAGNRTTSGEVHSSNSCERRRQLHQPFISNSLW